MVAIETLSDVEMNTVDRQILNVETGRSASVVLDGRTARALFVMASGMSPQIDQLEKEIEELRNEIDELRYGEAEAA